MKIPCNQAFGDSEATGKFSSLLHVENRSRAHAMMIALARQKPDLASACFAAALAVDAPDAKAMQAAVSGAEERHADHRIQRHSPRWYAHVHRLDGCVWAPD